MTIDARRRRLIYRASHRGMKEMDLILGAFARARVPQMDDVALQQFEALCEVPDQQFYDWITGREEAPTDKRHDVFQGIRAFCDGESGIAIADRQ